MPSGGQTGKRQYSDPGSAQPGNPIHNARLEASADRVACLVSIHGADVVRWAESLDRRKPLGNRRHCDV